LKANRQGIKKFGENGMQPMRQILGHHFNSLYWAAVEVIRVNQEMPFVLGGKSSSNMKNKLMRKLVILLLPFMLLACDKEERAQIALDSIIQIEVKEEVSGGASHIWLVCKTEKKYPCFNYKISAAKQATPNSIEILFKSITGDDKCATAFGPATVEINLGALSDGVYHLQLNTPTTENKGLLKVTATQIILEFNQSDGIEILTPVVQR
jgi:hypothetical protein